MKSLFYSSFMGFIATIMIILLLILQHGETAAQETTAHTLILTNEIQLKARFGITATNTLMQQIQQLAAHPAVSGTLLRLEEVPAVAAAYASWQSNPLSVTQANAVADAIHTVIQAESQDHLRLAYVLLVGDDQVIPHRRVSDKTDSYSEKNYSDIPSSTTVGAAFAATFFLSDDFYGDQQITTSTSVTFYQPTLAVGRLVETPAEMEATIAQFLKTDGQLRVTTSLISGYDFTHDTAQRLCATFTPLLPEQPDCEFIGDGWHGNSLNQRLQTSLPNLIFLHPSANHWQMGTPDNQVLQPKQLTTWLLPTGGRLVYNAGPHAGLNVPPETPHALDWPQAWLGQGAVYIANTGYSWGHSVDIGLSEKLGVNLAEQLALPATTTVGQAFVAAKQAYYQSMPTLSPYDTKVMNELTLYGLPMYRIDGFNGAQADAFEPDNDCIQAQSIATDDVLQLHTLHKADDVDWLRFEASAGTAYRIEGSVAPSATLALAISLYPRHCPTTSNHVTASDITTSAVGSTTIEFKAPTTATYFFKIRNFGKLGGNGAYTLANRVLTGGTANNRHFLPLIAR